MRGVHAEDPLKLRSYWTSSSNLHTFDNGWTDRNADCCANTAEKNY